MIKRPKNSDTEDDILRMQNEFLAEKQKNKGFEPAAKLVKVESAKKLSKFAQQRANVSAVKEKPEKDVKFSNIIIGNVVERTESDSNVIETTIYEETLSKPSVSFPTPQRINQNVKLLDGRSGQSIFAQSLAKNDVPSTSYMPNVNGDGQDVEMDFGTKSHVIENNESESIHKENVELLQRMSKEQIVEERKRLLGSVDPALVQFLKHKRKANLSKIVENKSTDIKMQEIDSKAAAVAPFPEMDVLKDENSKNWLHFDVIEPSKLEWMRDLPNNLPKLKAGEQYEARFDWKGILLPFNLKDEGATDPSTELYLHGDDAHRPGYTLQELFRLARSKVIQQRISALRAVGGILSIYNQGYYDGIFELPISKIFFLLRYAFDDNTASVLEVTAKALAALFYNETDEVLLDITYDCSFDCVEPTLEIQCEESGHKVQENLEMKFQKMTIQSNVVQTNLNDEDDDELMSMNDFHLAETDLIRCLLRTNILQRITYIFTALNRENSTKFSCVKILIRLARTSEDVAQQILSHSNLVKVLIDQFDVSSNQKTDRNQSRMMSSTKVHLLKLFRVICAYGDDMINRLRDHGMFAVLKTCVFVQENCITVDTVKKQIESLRCVRTILMFSKSNDVVGLYSELIPALRYTLQWIYQFVIFQDENHFLFRQCASALIALLSKANTVSYSSFDKLSFCFSKWFTMAAQYGNLELSQVVLLATCLNAIQPVDAFRDFLQNYLPKFVHSSTYHSMCKSLTKSSGILSSYKFRRQDHKPLPHLHSIVFNAQNLPVFIVSERPTIHFINSVIRFYNNTKYPNDGSWLDEGIVQYVEHFARNSAAEMSLNWFLRQEIIFMLDLLKSSVVQSKIDKKIQLQMAYKVVGCLTEGQTNELLTIFSQFIFNIEMYPNRLDLTLDTMNRLKSNYAQLCVERFLNTVNAQDGHLRENFNRMPMLANDWPGMLLLKMYKNPDELQVQGLPEKDVISTTIAFLSLQNANGMETLSKTEQFIYTMIAFLGKKNSFLDEDMKMLLSKFVQTTFTSHAPLDFDADSCNKFNFENLYIAFLDHFQGESYGDRTFGQLVMVPLAQKHNIKWRKMIWSEHLHALRFVCCSETELIGELRDYLEPVETDVSLLKNYFQALNSTILLPDKAPYTIAQHHYNAFKTKVDRKNKMDTT